MFVIPLWLMMKHAPVRLQRHPSSYQLFWDQHVVDHRPINPPILSKPVRLVQMWRGTQSLTARVGAEVVFLKGGSWIVPLL